MSFLIFSKEIGFLVRKIKDAVIYSEAFSNCLEKHFCAYSMIDLNTFTTTSYRCKWSIGALTNYLSFTATQFVSFRHFEKAFETNDIISFA